MERRPRPETGRNLFEKSFYLPPQASFVPSRRGNPEGHGGDPTDSRFLEEGIPKEILRLYRLALRLSGHSRDAEDLAQETLLRAIRSDPDWRQPKPWRNRILVNVWRDRIREKGRKGRQSCDTELGDLPARLVDPASQASYSELRDHVEQALKTLSPIQRAIMALKVEEDLSVADIAHALESTPERVKANLWHARQKLRKALKGVVEEL